MRQAKGKLDTANTVTGSGEAGTVDHSRARHKRRARQLTPGYAVNVGRLRGWLVQSSASS